VFSNVFAFNHCINVTQSVDDFCVVSEHVDDIVMLIFQYINLLQKVGPQEWIFRECQVCARVRFQC